MEIKMKNIEFELDYEQIEITPELSVELKLPIPSGKYYLTGMIDVGYEYEADDLYFYFNGLVADVLTENGDDIDKIIIVDRNKISKAARDVFENILKKINGKTDRIYDRIYCEEVEGW